MFNEIIDDWKQDHIRISKKKAIKGFSLLWFIVRFGQAAIIASCIYFFIVGILLLGG